MGKMFRGSTDMEGLVKVKRFEGDQQSLELNNILIL